MKILDRVVGPIQTNCYFMVNEANNECVIVDPGAQASTITAIIKKNEYKPQGILLTHGHFDHIGAVEELKNEFNIKVYAGEDEADVISSSSLNLSVDFGVGCITKADVLLRDNQEFELAGIKIKVIFTPGHTKGSVCYYVPAENALFSGDTLFCQSVGRTDFVTGSHGQIVRSLRDRLFTLPDETRVYPGHGEFTQIDFEKENNPYA